MDKQEWNGEGLPPVGLICEIDCGFGGWERCEIIAHHNGKAIFHLKHNNSYYSAKHGYRPIPSLEDKVISEMVADTFVRGHGPLLYGRERIARMLYRAGWRKTRE